MELQIGESYLFHTITNKSFTSTVISLTEKSVSCNVLGESSITCMPLEFIQNSFCLSSLIPGNRYTFFTHDRSFDANFIDILEKNKRQTLRVDNMNSDKFPNCVHTMSLFTVKKIKML